MEAALHLQDPPEPAWHHAGIGDRGIRRTVMPYVLQALDSAGADYCGGHAVAGKGRFLPLMHEIEARPDLQQLLADHRQRRDACLQEARSILPRHIMREITIADRYRLPRSMVLHLLGYRDRWALLLPSGEHAIPVTWPTDTLERMHEGLIRRREGRPDRKSTRLNSSHT